MKRLDKIFNISYGTKLDKNKTKEVQKKPILFVSRTSKNHGIDLICEKQIGVTANPVNTISVPLGGEGRLMANVQFDEYYNGQNVAILSPINKAMTLQQLIYYSLIIRKNQFKYSAFGREANSTLKSLLIPDIDEIPAFVNIPINMEKTSQIISKSIVKPLLKPYKLVDLFLPLQGTYISEEDAKKCSAGEIAFVSSGRFNNGVKAKIQLLGMEATIFPSNCLSLAKNGSVCTCFYHEGPIVTTSDVITLQYKNKVLNKYEGLFFKVLIEKHMFRFNYGRKINEPRLNEIKLFVPFNEKTNDIDYEYINSYIKNIGFADLI